MNKLNRKITIVTNLLLVAIFCVVCVIVFIPQSAVQINSGEIIGAIYNGNRENKKVSLMFNVYENTEVVHGIVKVLDEYDAKATFFVGGCWADDNKETLETILKSGHQIGNHGYFHKDHKTLDYEANEQEIFLTEKVVEVLSGAKTDLFAPPSGSFSETTLEVAFNLGYKVIMWSKDTIDWRDKDENLIFKRATNNLENGDLVLMHPKQQTLNALPKILQFYLDSGFSVVTVENNLL